MKTMEKITKKLVKISCELSIYIKFKIRLFWQKKVVDIAVMK